MNRVSKIYALNTTVIEENLDKSIELGAMDALVVDPIDPSSIISNICPDYGDPCLLKGADFSEVIWQTACLARRIRKFLYEEGGSLIVFIRPLQTIYLQNSNDFSVNNYDWLWSGIGRDYTFSLNLTESERITLTEIGSKGPFGEYLSLDDHYNVVVSGVSGTVLAINEDGETVAFILSVGKGKVIFLPRFYGNHVSSALKKGILRAREDEWWPERTLKKESIPWLQDYPVSKVLSLEDELSKKYAQIEELEGQLESLYNELIQLDKLREFILSGVGWQIAEAVTTILNSWGFKALCNGNQIYFVHEDRKALILTEESECIGPAWIGNYLIRLLEPSVKGIIILNPYRFINPVDKKFFFSDALKTLAIENDLALLTNFQFFKAYQNGNSEIIQKLFQTKGCLDGLESVELNSKITEPGNEEVNPAQVTPKITEPGNEEVNSAQVTPKITEPGNEEVIVESNPKDADVKKEPQDEE